MSNTQEVMDNLPEEVKDLLKAVKVTATRNDGSFIVNGTLFDVLRDTNPNEYVQPGVKATVDDPVAGINHMTGIEFVLALHDLSLQTGL